VFLRERCRVLSFRISLALLILTSLLVFALPVKLLLLVAIAITMLFLYVAGFEQLFTIVKRFALFVAPLAIASLFFQIAAGFLNLLLLAITITRIYTLYTVSLIVVKCFSAKELLSLSRGLGPKFFTAILLALKLMHYSALLLNDVRDVYRVNLGYLCGKRFLCRVMLFVVWVRAFVQLFTVKALEVGEAMYTRYRGLVGVERGR